MLNKFLFQLFGYLVIWLFDYLAVWLHYCSFYSIAVTVSFDGVTTSCSLIEIDLKK